MKASPLKEAFNAGEFSPLMGARVRMEKYANALQICENMIPIVQGGVTRRSGSMFVSEVKTSSSKTRIIPFEFNVTQAYILEFGDQYIRFYKDNGNILEAAQSITGITNANPGVLTYSGSDPSNGETFYLSDIGGMTELNGKFVIVSNVNAGANTYELKDYDGNAIDTTAYGTYTSGGTMARVYTIASPYTAAQLFDLKFTQSADVMYLTHPSHAPRKLSRTGHTSWTLSTIDFIDGPYLLTNTSTTTIAPSATSGTGITLTASSAVFASTDVGRLVRILHSSTWGYAKITAFTSSTQVTADVKSNFAATTGSADWRLGVWSGTTGYPACCTFFEDRLFFAGSTNNPQRMDGSSSGLYENFAPSKTDGTVVDSNALAFSLNASDVNVIRWMIDDEKGLLIGSVGGEWILRPNSLSEALSPTNVTAKRSTAFGSANVQAVRAGRASIYVQRAGRKVRELAYVYEVDGFRSPDMTVLSEHITKGGLGTFDYQQEPWSVLWFVRSDGQLVGLTYERDQDVVGWHRHIMGGSFDGGDSVVESVATIPAPDGTKDELWMIVKRTINGVTRRYIEYVTPYFDDDDTDTAFFVDCGLTYDGAPATTISGLDHLEGQTVSILADGSPVPDLVVTNGVITLSTSASIVNIGLPYNSDIKTLRIEAGAADGTAQGKTKRIHRVTLRLYKTVGLKYGPDSDHLDDLIFRTAANNLNEPIPLFTGDKSFNWNGYYEKEGTIHLRQSQPLPFTLLGIFPQLVTQDR